MKKIFSRFYIIFISLSFSLNLFAQQNDEQKKTDAAAAKVCADIKAQTDKVKAWIDAHKGSKPDIPVPPIIDPDCHDCKDKNPTNQNQQKIDAFAKKSIQPEADMMKTLLNAARQKALFGEGGNILPGDNMPYAGKYSCFNKPSDGDLKTMFEFLEKREWDKASGMLMKYKSNGEYFPGGIQYYLGVLRDLTMTGYLPGNGDMPPEVTAWINKYYEKYQNRFFNEHQYQLFTPLFYLPRQVMLISGSTDLETGHKLVNVNGKFELQEYNPVIEMYKKAIAFMHFKLKITYTGQGTNAKGDEQNVKMTGEAEVQCNRVVNDDDDCFEWVAKNGSMQFTVDQASFKGHDKEKIDYESPKKFSVPVKFNVNMCDKNPVFRMYFDALWPAEEHYSHSEAGALDESMLNHLISSTLGDINKDNLMKYSDKLEQNAPDESEMDAWNKRMEEHANDPNYFKTPQGQKDLATANQLKKEYGTASADAQKAAQEMKESMKNNDQSNTQANTKKLLQSEQEMTGGAISLNKIEAPFKIGNSLAVDATLSSESSGEGYKGSFKITLQNTPEKK